MSRFLVTAATRRKAFLLDENGNALEAVLRTQTKDVVCGDYVSVERDAENSIITSVQERKNLLSRSYGEKTKLLAANLDLLCIVTAVSPPYNAIFVDRTIAACVYEGIPHALIINKTDLDNTSLAPYLKQYQSLGIPVVETCTKSEGGIDALEKFLEERGPTILALCGISGVGKSSLLNRLIPNAVQKTSDVSWKTGQGKQTTSMAQAYHRQHGVIRQVIIDLPGLQNFGVSHIPLASLRDCFLEFVDIAHHCQFLDCSHIQEPNCAVVSALKDGSISQSRYDSYLHMREELVRGKPY